MQLLRKILIIIKEHYESPKRSTNARRSGRSTRMADKFIQQLFTTGRVKIYDHHGTREADKFLYRTVIDRLRLEHPYVYEKAGTNPNTLSISLNS